MYFQLTVHRFQTLVDSLSLSMPFCTLGTKRHETGKNEDDGEIEEDEWEEKWEQENVVVVGLRGREGEEG